MPMGNSEARKDFCLISTPFDGSQRGEGNFCHGVKFSFVFQVKSFLNPASDF